MIMSRRRHEERKLLTVEQMAAGTLAMMDMTGLRFKSMKIYQNVSCELKN